MMETAKKALISLSILFLSIASASAQNQFPSQLWHKGNIYTTDGQVFGGKIKYDLDNNVVQLQDQTIETFTSTNVTYFEFFDEVYGGVRKFYSLPYAFENDYATPIFFEVLTEGEELALLCREYVATDSRGMGNFGMMGGYGMNPYYGPQSMMMGQKLAFNYYFLKNGKIEQYSLKKKDLFEMLPGHDDQISLFMRKNRLDYDKRGDLLRITAYYNELNQN
ncbi:hypothetical protein ACPUEN_07150 [Algoriphagus yeomjeoni]|uniref:hypothetical protein n=1 Tax=Algoriphagus yeomjeoni TaxID=291403 RepID=UPI003CE5C708